MVTMMKRTESLSRSVEELEALAAYYDTHDTLSEMEDGEWVDPQPMVTTSLRLPSDVVEALKTLAQAQGMRYTAYMREIVEQAVRGSRVAERQALAHIDQRLERIEKVVAVKPAVSSQRTRSRKTGAAKSHRNSTIRKLAGIQGADGEPDPAAAAAQPHRAP